MLNNKLLSHKKAFTMIELIFVIVILGIVSSIGAEIIAKVYDSYIIQRAQHRASIKTELAAIQIANRLANAIPGTVVRKSSPADGTPTSINEVGTLTDTILQWVGSDVDSFNTMNSGTFSGTTRRPGWNGFCDVDNSPLGGTSISTPGSNLNLATTVIGNLGGAIAGAQIYFPMSKGLQSYGVASGAGETITLDAAPANGISEHYKLAWSSYALVADGDLTLYYNFPPIVDQTFTVNTTKEILLRNVSTFEFRGDGRTIRFKLCVDEEIGQDFNITICKEKAVF